MAGGPEARCTGATAPARCTRLAAVILALTIVMAAFLVVGAGDADAQLLRQCSNLVDDDGDGLTDFPADRGCTSATDNSEINTQCVDGVDNDGDSRVDHPADGGCTGIGDNTENLAPVAGFIHSPSPATVGQVVTFQSTSTDADPTNGRLSFAWDVGNVTFGDQSVAHWKFDTAGTYRVRLRVSDAFGASATVTRTVLVIDGPPVNHAPVPSFTFAPQPAVVRQPVTFTSTSADDGAIVGQVWDLDGDAAFDDAAGPAGQYVFPAAGNYVVSLKVTDDQGVWAVAFQTIQVSGQGSATQDASSGPAPGSSVPAPRPPAAPAPTPGRARLLSPFPIVRIAGSYVGGVVRIRLMSVRAPKGATVRVLCTGRACPFQQARHRAKSWASSIRVRRLEKKLPKGTILEVFVTKSGQIGKYTNFTIRGGAAPSRRDSCARHGAARASRCPG